MHKYCGCFGVLNVLNAIDLLFIILLQDTTSHSVSIVVIILQYFCLLSCDLETKGRSCASSRCLQLLAATQNQTSMTACRRSVCASSWKCTHWVSIVVLQTQVSPQHHPTMSCNCLENVLYCASTCLVMSGFKIMSLVTFFVLYSKACFLLRFD